MYIRHDMIVNSVYNSSYKLREAPGAQRSTAAAAAAATYPTTYQLQLPRVSRIRNTYHVLYV
jgi:hypothetical protein